MADKILNDEGLATFASEVKGYVNDTVKSANIANLDTLVFKNYYDSNAPIYNIFMQDNKIKLKSWNQTDDTVIPSMITGITAVPTDNSDVANKKYVDDAVSNSSGNIDLSAYAKTADLSTVATSGLYDDLKNKPDISVLGYISLNNNNDILVKTTVINNNSSKLNSIYSKNIYIIGDGKQVSLSFWDGKLNLRKLTYLGTYPNGMPAGDLETDLIINGVNGVPTADDDVANKKYVDDQIATVSGGNIDLTGYATESWVEGKGYTTMTAVEAKGYLTAHQDLSTYALKSEIPTIPTKVSAFENDKGYLTAHQSLANYALKSEIPSLTDYSTTAQVQEMISSAIGQIVDGNEVSY